MKTIYFSPHLDDAIFSCGGIIANQVNAGKEVAIWTFFTADPPTGNLTFFARILHHRWGKQGSPYQLRREEDIEACRYLSVDWKHFDFRDCIYRHYPSNNSPLIHKTSDLFSPVKEPELTLEESLYQAILENLSPQDQIVLPMEAGGHIDHILTKKIGNRFPNQKSYYPDFPYAGKLYSEDELNLPQGAVATRFSLLAEEIMQWKKSAYLYNSQISSFWKSQQELEEEIDDFVASPFGGMLWSFPD